MKDKFLFAKISKLILIYNFYALILASGACAQMSGPPDKDSLYAGTIKIDTSMYVLVSNQKKYVLEIYPVLITKTSTSKLEIFQGNKNGNVDLTNKQKKHIEQTITNRYKWLKQRRQKTDTTLYPFGYRTYINSDSISGCKEIKITKSQCHIIYSSCDKIIKDDNCCYCCMCPPEPCDGTSLFKTKKFKKLLK